MLHWIRSQLLLEGANDNTGGGGAATGGAGSAGQGAGNSSSGGGSGLLTGKESGSSGGGATDQGKATGDQSGGADTTIKFPDNWKLALSKELQESGALKLINDIPALAKSFIHAQSLIGADKIPLPSKHATKEEWRAVQLKLGLPADAKDYKIEHAKDGGLSEAFVPQLAAKAHEIGILPAQAKELADWMGAENKNALASSAKTQQHERQVEVDKLKTEWGAVFPQKLSEAQQALSHFATPEEIKYIETSGLTNDPQLVRIFAKVGEMLKEDGVIKEGATGAGGLTPAEAQRQLDVIQRDMNHPFYSKDHPNHAQAMAEVTKLRNQTAGPRK